ncbi:MAG: cyclase family protein [Halanaerobiales bacterium]|nr:cyclase family protein [Halanaerobiales bacterium]
MFIDLTLEITPEIRAKVQQNQNRIIGGHLGTHFDVMDKKFPLEYLERDGIIFDVSTIRDRDIKIDDIKIEKIKSDMFVAFHSNFIEDVGYGEKEYFKEHPQLSKDLIDTLLEKNISIIGVDFTGIRREEEHTMIDEFCAEEDVFIVENLCNLKEVLKENSSVEFTAHTYPVKYTGMSGLPCRVVAEI